VIMVSASPDVCRYSDTYLASLPPVVFAASKKAFGYGKKKENKKVLASHSPGIFWCGHYNDPNTGQSVPDGNTCCFNHWVGLPTRWNQRHPIYPEQEQMIRDVLKHLYIAIEKEPKRGITELYIRFALWMATKDDGWQGGQVCITVSTNIGEAETMITRCKGIISHKMNINEDYNTKKEFSINLCLFKAIPANNIDAIRSKTNMKLIIVDEAAFFKMLEQSRVREAIEHYIGGSDVMIVLISTAGEAPEGIMYEILHVEKNSVYHKIITNYKDGLKPHKESNTTIFSKKGIETAMRLKSWARNYLHSWHSGEGDIFSHEEVDGCMVKFDRMFDGGQIIIAIDPAYGTSDFGVVVGILKDNILYIVYSKGYTRRTPTFMIGEVQRLYKLWKCSLCLCDGHYSGEIRDLREKHVTVNEFAFDTENKSNMVNSTTDRVTNNMLKIWHGLHDLAGQMKAVKSDKKGHIDKSRMSLDELECLMMICERMKTSSVKIIKI